MFDSFKKIKTWTTTPYPKWFTRWYGLSIISFIQLSIFIFSALHITSNIDNASATPIPTLHETYSVYKIPDNISMLPTINEGDYVLVKKSANNLYSTSSFNKDALTINRGDVIIYSLPKYNNRKDIKRIIGVSGDTVEIIDNKVYINGEKLHRKYVEDIIFRPRQNPQEGKAAKYIEYLADGRGYHIMDIYKFQGKYFMDLIKVPEDYYFVLGDNRDFSLDSRHEKIGLIHKSQIVSIVQDVIWNEYRQEDQHINMYAGKND